MSQTNLFSAQDLQRIASLVLDLSLKPRYNALNESLVWEDELPVNITRDGLDVLQTLWYARALFHKGLTIADHPIDPAYSKRVWEQALKIIPQWPGFQRMILDSEDRDYFEEQLDKEDPF